MTGTKKIAMFGSAAALAFAVGFGGVGVSPPGNTPTTTTHPATSVHFATLTGCVAGLNC
jgi:hypothetical protein